MTEWYYTKMGLKQRPVPEDELRQKIRRGEICETTLVWRDGMAEWLPLAQVAELGSGEAVYEIAASLEQVAPESVAEDAVTPPTPPTLRMPVGSAMGSIPIEQPPAYHGNYVAPNIPSYLVPSVIGTCISVLLMFVFCLAPGVITGIVAIVYASKVDSLKAQGNMIEATSASKTAKVWMIVTYSLLSLPVIGGIVLTIFAVLTS